MKKLLLATILSLFSISAFADVQWTVNEELGFKYTTSCPKGKFDAIYIYQESSAYLDDAVKKYENSEECTLVAIVTDPEQQGHWDIHNQNFIDMMTLAGTLPVPVYLEIPK